MTSWGTCDNNGCNNIHFNKPPLVSDGRLYTAYDSTEATMEKIRQYEKINTNWDYRMYLQKNAKDIMKYNNIECFYSLGINPTTSFDKPMSSTPITYTSNRQSKEPPFGYCNNNSDLKNYYLTREQLNSKMISPSIVMK
jgi:hypothetical protein